MCFKSQVLCHLVCIQGIDFSFWLILLGYNTFHNHYLALSWVVASASHFSFSSIKIAGDGRSASFSQSHIGRDWEVKAFAISL